MCPPCLQQKGNGCALGRPYSVQRERDTPTLATQSLSAIFEVPERFVRQFITSATPDRAHPTVPLNNFRVRTEGVQENQMHCDVSCTLEVPNLDFQPIPPLSKF